jgi:spore coat polysaccharide biosynthesis protein SpsF
MAKVAICIQARSTSQRLPGKSLKLLDGKPLIQYAIDAAIRSSKYINGSRSEARCEVALLVPKGDQILTKTWPCVVIIGDERNVLERYVKACSQLSADYVVRITGDCCLLPSHVITKCINVAVNNQLDYVSNVDERFRTSVDGFDCEVISRRAMKWLAENAIHENELEHVTLALRTTKVKGFTYGCVIDSLDFSETKLSVDTQEDFDRIEQEIKKVKQKEEMARSYYGPRSVYRVYS